MSEPGLWRATTNAELQDIFRDFGILAGNVSRDPRGGMMSCVLAVLPEDLVLAESVAALIELPAGVVMRVEPTLRRHPPL